VVGLAVLGAVLRLPFLGAPLSPDEGGYLAVARQWSPGTSLYGHYWVDRPPLLLEIFRAADGLGGLTALRIVGCLAVFVTVLGVGLAARRAAGTTAATWSAAVACGLLASPLLGTATVNGELLAAPFVAFGIWFALGAVRRPAGRLAAVGAGATAAAAVLVKQNMLDVVVFAGALALAANLVGLLTRRQVLRLLAAFTAGAAAVGSLVLAVAAARGSSPGGIFYAMYPFRLHAVAVLSSGSVAERVARLQRDGTYELLSLGPVILVGLLVVLVRRWPERRAPGFAVGVATLATAAFASTSIALGGSYWLHYLVQLVVPTALAAGLLVAASPRPGRRAIALVLTVAAVGWAFGLTHHTEARGPAVGAALARVTAPADTAVSLLGDADVLEASGMTSPYPYLWSLPARTLDPDFRRLQALLDGPAAPTWLVTRGPASLDALLHRPVGEVLTHRYHRVADICGHGVYLRDGVTRPSPVAPRDCRAPMSPGFVGLAHVPSGGH
jgi:hypothetical protein